MNEKKLILKFYNKQSNEKEEKIIENKLIYKDEFKYMPILYRKYKSLGFHPNHELWHIYYFNLLVLKM